MTGPQSPLIPLVLAAAFAGLLVWLARTRRLALRVLAGALAFVPPMVAGTALVNDYYDYYSRWRDVWGDLSGKGPADLTDVASVDVRSAARLGRVLAAAGRNHRTRMNGMLFSMPLPGGQSGITRDGTVYLPPQYFQQAYAHRRLPVVELLHGSPGSPASWEYGVHASAAYRGLLAQRKAAPAVLVMPDSNGGRAYSLQCLNEPKGVQDETYLVDDVPRDIAARLRVEPPGPRWALAGFSEGGYCAANIALRDSSSYGAVGIMSGYFAPDPNSGPSGKYDPFHGDRRLREQNTPIGLLRTHAVLGTPPPLWLGAGGSQKDDMAQARSFLDALRPYRRTPPFMVVKGAGHSYVVWRRTFPAFLEWALPLLRPSEHSRT
ncbi:MULTISPECIES: alpha/beta hydrolase [Actinomadura]|uniref:Alpha/beta hydrolase n=1 Tax=Actinomadura yumaensis TaxID=111807 RepID=A0ABW2CHS4_9ACTN|nr:alpha/beta hydrolase-fold protein [Actinomadura sp. J1-007]MWK34811.1 hypothetical protein [Actinomadura sp. J1-007]